jgi:hypothetical protein
MVSSERVISSQDGQEYIVKWEHMWVAIWSNIILSWFL